MQTLFGAGAELNVSEDALYLNVWTPGCDDARRPVMVWIHGGAFILGSGDTPWYHGDTFAKHGDVVVVTLNYRLGAFGFLHLADQFGDALRRLRQRGHPRPGRGTGMGAREHRLLRRESRRCHDLRRVGRRRERRHAARAARGARPVPEGDAAERRGVVVGDARTRRRHRNHVARRARREGRRHRRAPRGHDGTTHQRDGSAGRARYPGWSAVPAGRRRDLAPAAAAAGDRSGERSRGALAHRNQPARGDPLQPHARRGHPARRRDRHPLGPMVRRRRGDARRLLSGPPARCGRPRPLDRHQQRRDVPHPGH